MTDRNNRQSNINLGLEPTRYLLNELNPRLPPDRPSDGATVVADFTFRLPVGLLNEIRDMARAKGCTVNAMMAGLIDYGLISEGRVGILEGHPDYVRYLQRGKRGAQ